MSREIFLPLQWQPSSTQLYAMNCRIGGSATTKKSGESRDPIRWGRESSDDVQNHRSLYQHVWKGEERKERNGGERSFDRGTRVAELGLA